VGYARSSMDLELLVIGSGPSGQKAAIQAAKLGRRAAVVERPNHVGGISIHSGTVPSKTLREAVFEELSRRAADVPDPLNPELQERFAIEFLRERTAHVVAAESALVREQFRRNRVGVLYGVASFVDDHTLCVEDDRTARKYSADHIIIAVGTVPYRPPGVEFDDRRVVDSDGILRLGNRLPRTMAVVGAGVIGVEYASMFAALGTKVTLVDQRERLMPFLDGEIGEAMQFLLRRRNVTFRFGERVEGGEVKGDGVITHLASGKDIPFETVLYAAGRQGATERLKLENAGLQAGRRGLVPVDENYRTAVPHIFAVGDVAGPPGLAATGFEQGRLATLHAFGEPAPELPDLVPTGVYAIPEIGMVGRTEEQLTDAAVPYIVGIARWRELTRGIMRGDEDGLLKILVSPDDGSLLGVHVIGTSAADLVHIGQALMGREDAVGFLVAAVFNYPTFAEAYKIAALDAVNRMRAIAVAPAPPVTRHVAMQRDGSSVSGRRRLPRLAPAPA
jgi:NAD(P) transhydrogenase